MFYIKWLDLVLERNLNEFKLENFDELIKTEEYSFIKKGVRNDLNIY